ncbi:putative 2,5-diketo-D-gluconic acid reductase [Acetobacteraceae bacterium EV16G]|uniref:2,5-diketo-D-gluconic acid reductase n=1 Tax=Sorlinia euscelidii TaxID=3081148 RepID=A0ABU7U0H4_9PROT
MPKPDPTIQRANAPDFTLKMLDGKAIPQLGLGVYKTPADETAEIVDFAAGVGYKMVDTAAFYHNEEGVGQAVKRHHDLFVTTKLWNTGHGYDVARRAFDESMKKLGLDVLDLYLIHWPAPKNNLYVETWKALIELKKEGRIKSIGVSNFNVDHLERIIHETGEVPVINQIELHPAFQQRHLRAFHDKHGIITESWSPLGRGANLDNDVIQKLAKKHGKSPAQIVIRWHLDQGLVVIPKSSNHQRLQENIDVFDFHLDAADLADIEKMDRADGRVGPDPMTADF